MSRIRTSRTLPQDLGAHCNEMTGTHILRLAPCCILQVLWRCFDNLSDQAELLPRGCCLLSQVSAEGMNIQ